MQYKCLFFNAYFRTYKCFYPQKSKQKLVGNWKPGATTNTISKEFKEISLSRAPIPKFHCFDTRAHAGWSSGEFGTRAVSVNSNNCVQYNIAYLK